MNFDQFETLGDQIRAELSVAHGDYAKLPGIAASALRNAELDDAVDLRSLARFLVETKVKQQPGTYFSNLPPVVYRCDDFHIELLFWANATAHIHQHGFSGAFCVFSGSSFHSRWTFDEQERISQRLLIGQCNFQSAEILTKGDVCEIHSGRNGLLHALFHLDQPSVTIVVRSHSDPWAQPQYSLRPPNVALDEPGIQSDGQIRLVTRLLNTSRILGEDIMPVVLDCVESFDLPRLFGLTDYLLKGILDNDDEGWDIYIQAVRRRFGDHAALFSAGRQEVKRSRSLIATRDTVTDPDLRFFIALLLNTPSREWIYKLCAARYPGQDPEAFCVEALDRLRGREQLANAFSDLVQKAKLGQYRFGARLGNAIQFEQGDARVTEMLKSCLNGATSTEKDMAVMQGNLRDMAELAPLFR